MAETLVAARTGAPTRRWREIVPADQRLRHPSTRAIAHLPGRRGLPLLGVMPEILADPLGFCRRMTDAHGRLYRFHAFGNWHVHAAGPEANEKILFDSEGIFSAKLGWGQLIEPLFPGALLIKDGPEHRADRRIMAEAFRHAEMQGYQRIFAKDIEAAIHSWQGRTIDAYAESKRLTFHIAASTFVGTPLEAEGEEAVASLAAMIRSLLAMVKNPLPSLVRIRGNQARRRLEQILTRLIREKRAAPSADFLSRMAALKGDEGKLLEPKRICDSFAFLLSAAHDTLASSLTSLLYYLAAHPEWAEAIRAELDEGEIDDPLAASSATLPVMDMVYKETLRLNGPAPVVWRRAARAFELEGHHIPAGTMVGANLMISHRLSQLWPDPERFDPLRFSAEAEQGRSRFAFVPFGAGVHKCLGMHFAAAQARIFMAILVRQVDVRLAGTGPVRWYQWPNCRPIGPLEVRVAPKCRGK